MGSRPLVCGGRLYNGRTESSCFALANDGTAWKAVRGMLHKRRFAGAVTFQDEGVYPKLSRISDMQGPTESQPLAISGKTFFS